MPSSQTLASFPDSLHPMQASAALVRQTLLPRLLRPPAAAHRSLAAPSLLQRPSRHLGRCRAMEARESGAHAACRPRAALTYCPPPPTTCRPTAVLLTARRQCLDPARAMATAPKLPEPSILDAVMSDHRNFSSTMARCLQARCARGAAVSLSGTHPPAPSAPPGRQGGRRRAGGRAGHRRDRRRAAAQPRELLLVGA